MKLHYQTDFIFKFVPGIETRKTDKQDGYHKHPKIGLVSGKIMELQVS